MEQANTLQHFGIKGQKWGLRRFQNKDGSLTEEGKIRYQNDDGSLTDYGKEHYMEGARSGKLDVQKLSDKDLQMINNRFNQERLFDQNVTKFQEEHKPVSEKLAQALVDKITASANNKSKSPSSNGFKKLFVDPILDAFKFDDLDTNTSQTQQEEEKPLTGSTDPEKGRGNGFRFFAGHSKESANDIATKPRIETGEKFTTTEYNQRADDPSWHKRVNHIDRDDPHNGSQTAEQILRGRSKKNHQNDGSSSSSSPEPKKKNFKLNNSPFSGSGKKKKKNQNNGNSNNNYTYRGYYDSYSAHGAFDDVFVITRDTDNAIAHYGITGQKWGIRRYQNEDGTLTEEGKARIAKTAGTGYLNPSSEDEKKGKAKERTAVSEKYSAEFWDHVKKGMPENGASDEGKKLWDKFKGEYASATLKDLKLNDTPKARTEVRKILSQIDPAYSLGYKNKYADSGDYDKFWEYENRRNERFAQRRNALEHPKRTKVKRVAKKTLDVAAKVAPIAGAII